MDATRTRPDPVTDLSAALQVAGKVRPPVGGFPYLAEALRVAGFGEVRYPVAAGLMLFRGPQGAVVAQAAPPVDGPRQIPAWDRDALVTAIRADQTQHGDIPVFAAACWAAGVTDHRIDLTTRTCTYHGADPADHYVESYPAVTLPHHP